MRSAPARLIGAMVLALASIARAAELPGVTVESERQRAQLRHDVDRYVSAAIMLSHADDQTVERWT